MTFSELVSDVYAEVGYQSSPATAVTTRIKKYINEGLRVVLGEPGMSRLLDSDTPATFASVASQARYVLPDIARIYSISERTNDVTLSEMSLQDYRRYDPDPTATTGTPTRFVPIGRVAVAVQPSDASEIFVDSTDAGDTGTCYIEGVITGGYKRTASVTMTGTTAVSLSAAITSFIEITDFYLSANAVGTVTLHEDASGGTELARITIGQKRPRYLAFYLWPTPSAAVTYYVDYQQELNELVNDTDEPPLPTNYHFILSDYARMRHWEQQDDSRFKVASEQFMRGLNRMKYAIGSGSSYLPTLGRGRWVGRSRLGGYYPADIWTRG